MRGCKQDMNTSLIPGNGGIIFFCDMNIMECATKNVLQRLEEKYKSELDREHKLVQDKDRIVALEQERSEGLRKKINELQDQVWLFVLGPFVLSHYEIMVVPNYGSLKGD